MDEKWIEQVRRNLESKSTAELLEIWQENDREAWTEEGFSAIRQILEARGENPGPQGQEGPAEQPPVPSRRERPGCVTATVLLLALLAGGYALLSLFGYFLAPRDEAVLVSLAVSAALVVLYGVIAAGLWLLKIWARIAFIVLQSLGTLLLIFMLFSGVASLPTLIGLAVGGFTIYWFAAHGEYFLPAKVVEPDEE